MPIQSLSMAEKRIGIEQAKIMGKQKLEANNIWTTQKPNHSRPVKIWLPNGNI